MVAISLLLALLGLATTAYSTSLTTLLTPNERLCFYADADKAGEKIGVRSLHHPSASSSTYTCLLPLVLLRCSERRLVRR